MVAALAPAVDDPFDIVRGQVSSALSEAERKHQKWNDVRRRKPVRNDDVARAHVALVRALEEVEADLGDLETTVDLVEADRARFKSLDDAEVASRRAFVRSSRRVCMQPATRTHSDSIATHTRSHAAHRHACTHQARRFATTSRRTGRS